jgi:hypothetical protein
MTKRKRDKKISYEERLEQKKRLWDHFTNNPTQDLDYELKRVAEIMERVFDDEFGPQASIADVMREISEEGGKIRKRSKKKVMKYEWCPGHHTKRLGGRECYHCRNG